MDVKGIYTAAANRYADADALYKRCGKSGVLLPKSVWDSGTTSEASTLTSEVVPSPTMLSTTALPISTLPTITALPTEVQKKPWAD